MCFLNIDTNNLVYNHEFGFKRTNLPTKDELKLPFYVIAFGRMNKEIVVSREARAKCYLVYSSKGCGKALIGDKWEPVPEGSVLYLPSGVPLEYAPADEEDWSTEFISFAGRFAESILGIEASVISGELSFIPEAVNALTEKYEQEDWHEYGNSILYFTLLRIQRILSTCLKAPKIENAQGRIFKSIKYISEHFVRDLPISALADYCGMCEQYYCRLFKKQTGQSPTAYIISLRIAHACDLLTKNENQKIDDIASACGFNSTPYFNKTFKKQMGMSPTEYRQRNKTQ